MARRRLHAWLAGIGPRHGKLYPFEVAILVQLGALHLILASKDLAQYAVLHRSLTVAARELVLFFAIGFAVNLAYAAIRRRARGYLRATGRWPWIFLSFRLLLGSAVVVHVYAWVKSMLQLLHPTLYDQALWELDQLLFFGFSPNVFFLYLCRAPAVLRFLDASYELIFTATLVAAFSIFFALGCDRVRVAFATGYSTLWLAGGWLYLLFPSLGPCYAYPEVWRPFVAHLSASGVLQRALWRNYELARGIPEGLISPHFNVLAGIAAFPSLHVGLQVFVALWAVRLSRSWAVPAYLSVAVVFAGSMVTGWHYFVDSLAGLALGWACFHAGHRLYGLRGSGPIRASGMIEASHGAPGP